MPECLRSLGVLEQGSMSMLVHNTRDGSERTKVQNVALKGLPELLLIEFGGGIVFGKTVRISANSNGRGADDVPMMRWPGLL